MGRIAWVMLLLAARVFSQGDSARPTVVTEMQEMLARSGHSPTMDEIHAVEAEPGVTDAAVAKELTPYERKALASADGLMREYGLGMLLGMQVLPDSPMAENAPAPAVPSAKPSSSKDVTAGPAAYKSEVARALVPLVPEIGARLTDEDPENRRLAAYVLTGFSLDPPAAVFPPLLAYLKRDDGVGPVGLAVVSALLGLGQVSAETASAIAKYLRRSDQTGLSKTELVEAIAANPHQNQTVNVALLGYLDADDPSLRARVILSLPQLDLAPAVFSDTKVRVEGIATGGQDGLQVVNAAKAVAGCWTAVKMTSGCPMY